MTPAALARQFARRLASRGIVDMSSHTGSVVLLLEILPDDATLDDVAEIAAGLERTPGTAAVLSLERAVWKHGEVQ